MKTSFRLLALLLLIAVLLCGCSEVLPEQTIVCKELTITLPGTFMDYSKDSAAAGLAFNYANQEIGVCATFEDKATLVALVPDIDANRYAELFLQTNGIDSLLLTADGIPQFSYEVTTDTTMRYLCGVFASEENFWVVQAYCASDAFEANREDMWSYIQTVKVQ